MNFATCLRTLTGIALLLTSSLAASAADERPNIIFIFTDDHCTPMPLSAYGSKINAWSRRILIASLNEGMLFKRCYVANSASAAPAGPSS